VRVPAPADRLSVLVVESDAEGREAFVSLLQVMGYDAVGAGSIADGIDVAAAFRPDVVIHDVVFHEGDITELSRSFRGWPDGDPFVVIYSGHSSFWVASGLELPYDAYIVKPEIDEVLSLLRDVASSPRGRRKVSTRSPLR
jgi:two-component system response regulator MprA